MIVNSRIHWFDDDWHVTAIHLHNIDKRPHSSREYYIHFFSNRLHIYIYIYIYMCICMCIYESMKRAKCMNEFDTYVYIYIYINSILIDDGDTKGNPKNALILCHHPYMYVCHFIISSPYLQKKTSGPETRETKNRLRACVYVYVRMYVCDLSA